LNTNRQLISLDGASGGGQMLRTALSLAMVTGLPLRMTNIRGKRRKSGLMRQHLTCVRAAVEISGGAADGAEIGSTELVFRAGRIRGGDYRFAIGTAGSTGLLLQTLLPALWRADAPSTLHLEGGTHNPMAPPFEFLDRVFLPAMARMGANAELELIESGFAPVGGGAIRCRIEPCPELRPLEWHTRGEISSLSLRIVTRDIPAPVPGRIRKAAEKMLDLGRVEIDSRDSGPGSGLCCQIEAEFDGVREMTSGFGEFGVSSERVARRVAKPMNDFLGSGAPVARHLADQLLLPLALAGSGSFTTMAPDTHVPTNMAVIEKFLPVHFQIKEEEKGKRRISID
jgi:RNA 3'-terminal phosphate cyclase (ATP)